MQGLIDVLLNLATTDRKLISVTIYSNRVIGHDRLGSMYWTGAVSVDTAGCMCCQ